MNDNTFKIERVSGSPVSDDEILTDLQHVAAQCGNGSVSQPYYREHGKFDDRTVSRRFGTWNHALAAAGLAISNEVNISDDRLFENLLNLWQHYGRQPRRRDLSVPPSSISQSPYNRRFGSWTSALESFVSFANSTESVAPTDSTPIPAARNTGRDPSLRLRYQVLKRDNFSCQQCGASPAKSVGIELHLDHMLAWSKGGLTTLENLRTLCSKCNLGKSNCA